MDTIKEKLLPSEKKDEANRNRADVNQQYKDSEFREKARRKTSTPIADSLNLKNKALKSLTGD
jgi:hypothetical protein